MKRILFVFLFLSLFSEFLFSKVSVYDEMFKYLGTASSNVMIESLESGDLDLVYSALKRIGQLRLTNARPKVIEVISAANPAANQGKVKQSIQSSDVFNIGVWALSRLGNEKDVALIAAFIKDAHRRDNQLYLFSALGEFEHSTNALRILHYYTEVVSDEQVARQIVNSIRRHGDPSSILYLIRMGNRPNFSDEFKAYIEKSVRDLGEIRKERAKQ